MGSGARHKALIGMLQARWYYCAFSRYCMSNLTWMLTLSMTQEMTWSTCIFVSHSVTCCNSWKSSPNMDSRYWKEEVQVLRLDEPCCHCHMFTVVTALIKNILTGRNCSVRNSKSSTGDSELSKKYILINGSSSFCISWEWQSVCALRCSKATQHKGNSVMDFSYKNELLQPPRITQWRIFSFNVVAVSIRTYSGGKRKD